MRESHSNIDKSQNEQTAETRKFISHFFLFGVQRKSAKKGSQYRGLQCIKLLTTHVVFKTATCAIHSYTFFFFFFYKC